MEKQNLIEPIATNANLFGLLKQEVKKIIVGNDNVIDFALIALISNGHILFEGPPGVAKTTLVKTLCDCLGLDFKRIQFTPDLLPSDLIGTLIFNQKVNDFETRKGPIFANLILADEINRAPAKVQAALLESMQENQVTIGSETYKLDKPFLVFATQNPIEQTGTYSLPEAQLDRFMFKLEVGYPTRNEELDVIKKSKQSEVVRTIVNKIMVLDAQKSLADVYVDDKILNYIVDVVYATRTPEKYNLDAIKNYIKFGASPRATLAIEKGARARALLNGRNFVVPEDVKFILLPTLRHRIILSYDALAENITTDYVIREIGKKIETP